MSAAVSERQSETRERTAEGLGGLFYGVYPGLVVDAQDPEQRGRVKLRFPWMSADEGPEVWARLATLSAGDGYGSWFPPAVGAEVLVAFEAGDVARPYVIGALWNGQERPPAVPGKQGYETQVLSTPRGTRIVFDESATGATLRLETPGGQRLLLSDEPEGLVVQDSSGAKVTLRDGDIALEAPGKVTVSAATVELTAATLKLDSALVQASGIVKCATLQTETVIANTYTPGAGNIV